MKVCFYLDNSRQPNTDLSKPENGNPGIGGTEYMIWTISYYLNKLYEDIEVYLMSPIIKNLPKEIKNIKVNNIFDVINKAKDIEADILIIRTREYDQSVYDLIDELKLKTITWSHNFENYNTLKYLTKCEYVKRNICVSKQQYHRLYDHEIFNKSTMIYNALDFSNYFKTNKDYINQENIVCYVGAIKPTKSFHILAKNWRNIVKKVPDAKLVVIGGGNLYDENARLGKYGIAEENYENSFINYIIDEDNKIIDSIKFLGVLGEDKKINVMSNAKVGIVNPIAKDETFCISAVEFQALGIPVVGRKRFGLLDTVDDNKSGLLFKTEKQMVNSIIHLLKNNEECKAKGTYGKKFVAKKFDINDICKSWRQLIIDVINDENTNYEKIDDNIFYDLKWIRLLNNAIKKFVKIPAVLEYPDCIYNNSTYIKFSNMKNLLIKKKNKMILNCSRNRE